MGAEDRLLEIAEYAERRNGWPLKWPADDDTWVHSGIGPSPDAVAALCRVVQSARWADVVWMAWKTGERDDAALDIALRSLSRALAALDNTQNKDSEQKVPA